MWVALFRKELRQLAPWAALIFGGLLSLTLLWFAFVGPGDASWAPETPLFDATASKIWNGSLLLWALLFAYAGFPREHDDETLAFLFTLPITRARLFAAKFLAAGGLLSAAVLLVEVTRWLTQLSNPESFSGHTFRSDWALASAGLGLLVAWINLGYATFLAVFRRFGLLLGLAIWTLFALLSQARPALRQLNPLELMHVEFYYSHALLPWKALFGHALVATLASLFAALIWVGPSEHFASSLSRAVTKTWVRWLFVVALTAAIVFICVLIDKNTKREGEPEFGVFPELSGPEGQLDTRRYRFRFREPLRARVRTLAETSDFFHDAVAQRLSSPATSSLIGAAGPVTEPIVVNLLKPSRTHAGTASWNAIRMALNSVYDDQALQRTLIHETTHVIALRASDRRTESHATTVRFFDEGLAEYTALELAPEPGQNRALWLQAALLRQREHVELAHLVDFPTLLRRFGEPAVYPLGFSWVQALVRTCGLDAPQRVLAALAQPQITTDSSGERLLRSILQLAHCDSTRVNGEWERSIDVVVTERKRDMEKIPALVGALQKTPDDDYVVRAVLEGNPLADAIYRLNVRGTEQDSIETQASSSAELAPDGKLEFAVPEDYVIDGALDFQLAILWSDDGVIVTHAQEWRHASVPGPATKPKQ